jgi:hypothetical protein
MKAEQPSFDAPIPGMSLTHELGARPWQSPAQFSNVEEVVEYYLERMSLEDFSDQLIDVMEMGVPVTDIANTLQLGGVMEGVHSIDTGILVIPLLIEMMMLIGDSAGVKYDSGLESNPNKDKMRKSKADKILRKLELKIDEKEDTPKKEMIENKPEMDMPTGLMARRN